MIARERLMEMLRYEPQSGRLIWLKSWGRRRAGNVAGCHDKDGYIQVGLDGYRMKAHRIIWLIVYGELPSVDIDHIDRNPSNNILTNLRLATRSQNLINSGVPCTSTSGIKGATFSKQMKKWHSYIQKDKKHIFLGSFRTKEEAGLAYQQAARNLFGEFHMASPSLTNSLRIV